jgi:hypothetical protein
MVCILLRITINKGGRFSVTTTIMISRFIYVFLVHYYMFRSLGTIIRYIHECKNIIITNMDPYQCTLYIIYCFI